MAVCCSSASLRALVISAYDGAGGPLGLAVRGVPHSSQNFACGRFSCWHRGQGIPSVSRVRIVSGQPGTASRHPGRRQSSASRPFHGARRPDPTPTRPRAPDGRFWGVVRPGACGETPSAAPTGQNSRLRHAPDGYTPSWRPDPDPLEPPPEPAERDAVETAGTTPPGGRSREPGGFPGARASATSPGRRTRRGRDRPRGASEGHQPQRGVGEPGSAGRPKLSPPGRTAGWVSTDPGYS